ncbi:MAG TPA: HAD-IA family hydrolase [Candidatus Caenarcaniphilales bacterium]
MNPSSTPLSSTLSTSAQDTDVAANDQPPTFLQALIFDMDGVLCDTMPYHLKAWARFIAQTPELPDWMRDYLPQMGGKRNSELLRELLGEHLTEADIQRWGSGKESVYRELIDNEIIWLPGLVQFLTQARLAGLKLGLGTSACRENVDLLLSHQDLGAFFEAAVIETDVKRGKPDPQCYLLVAERLGVAPPQCLVFEDATAGVEAARRAGMRCWGVLTTQSESALLAAGAERCIQDFNNSGLATLLPQVPENSRP